MDKLDYQFVAVPLNLFYCLDNNLRSMLFTLIQISTYKENEAIEKGKEWNGWFLAANRILADNSNLSENLVRVTLDTLYQNGIISIQSEGKGKGCNTPPNKIKINWERFNDFEKESIEDCIQDPRLAIETLEYSGSHYHPSYLKQENNVRAETIIIEDEENDGVNETATSGVKIEDNIYNIENKEIIYNKDNIKKIENKNSLEKNNKSNNSIYNILNNLEYYFVNSNLQTYDDIQVKSQLNEMINSFKDVKDIKQLIPTLYKILDYIKEHQDKLISCRVEELRDKIELIMNYRYKELNKKMKVPSTWVVDGSF